MKKTLWPVMLTPFTAEGSVDYPALAALIQWYEENGADGLFAVCQSSEVFYLSLRERMAIAAFVKQHAKVPVIASGHTAYAPQEQGYELQCMAETGVDAVVLITNRLAAEHDPADAWQRALDALLDEMDPAISLGLYECPQPYKRLLTDAELAYCAGTGRFRFLKDTCLDAERIRARLRILDGSPLRLYNAHTGSLLDSLRHGAAGYSGIMANFHPDLYAWLLAHYDEDGDIPLALQAALTMCSLVEGSHYPVCAKHYLQAQEGLCMTTNTRTKDPALLAPRHREEMEQLALLSQQLRDLIPR